MVENTTVILKLNVAMYIISEGPNDWSNYRCQSVWVLNK